MLPIRIRPKFAPININAIAHRLEDEKRNADGQQDIKVRENADPLALTRH